MIFPWASPQRWAPVLQRCWDVVTKYDTIPGTFLWEWADRAVADQSPTKLYYFFPETGINLLKIKGIVDGFRNPPPWYYDVKMIYSPNWRSVCWPREKLIFIS